MICTPVSQIKKLNTYVIHRKASRVSLDTFAPGPQKAHLCLHVDVLEKKPRCRECEPFIWAQDMHLLLLPRKLLWFFWITGMPAISFEGRHYLCILRLFAVRMSLKRWSWVKGSQCSVSLDVQKCSWSTENCLPSLPHLILPSKQQAEKAEKKTNKSTSV